MGCDTASGAGRFAGVHEGDMGRTGPRKRALLSDGRGGRALGVGEEFLSSRLPSPARLWTPRSSLPAHGAAGAGVSGESLGLRRIERLLTDEKARREDLERGLEYLKGQVAALQARIEELEQRIRQ